MDHPLAALAGEYAALLAAMVIDPGREKECEDRAKVIIARAKAQDWTKVTSATGVPFLWGGASFERECSTNYTDSPAQGDPWSRVSVNVPRGLGPYASWADSAIPAYRIDGLDKIGLGKWQWTTACYYGEKFNGFGPRNHGKHTGYLWAGSNIYAGGKYVSDGVWDPNAKDAQLGMVPLMVTMARLDPSLTFVDAFPGKATTTTTTTTPTTTTSTPIPPPQPVPVGHGGSPSGGDLLPDTTWLQQRLNALGASPQLVVDGNYGRQTERAVSMFQTTHGLKVDGLFGPDTFAAMTTAIQQAVSILTGTTTTVPVPPTAGALLKAIEGFGIVPDSDADKLLQAVIQKILSKTT